MFDDKISAGEVNHDGEKELEYTERRKIMFLYCLFIPNSMENDDNHTATDDCALCRAWSKKQAIKKFKKLYCNFDESNVSRVKYNKYGIAILTDY